MLRARIDARPTRRCAASTWRLRGAIVRAVPAEDPRRAARRTRRGAARDRARQDATSSGVPCGGLVDASSAKHAARAAGVLPVRVAFPEVGPAPLSRRGADARRRGAGRQLHVQTHGEVTWTLRPRLRLSALACQRLARVPAPRHVDRLRERTDAPTPVGPAPAAGSVTISLAEYNQLLDRIAARRRRPAMRRSGRRLAGRDRAACRRRARARHDHAARRGAAVPARRRCRWSPGARCSMRGSNGQTVPLLPSKAATPRCCPAEGAFTLTLTWAGADRQPSRAAPRSCCPSFAPAASAPPSTRRAKDRISRSSPRSSRVAPRRSGRIAVEATLTPGGRDARRPGRRARRTSPRRRRARCACCPMRRRWSPLARTTCA